MTENELRTATYLRQKQYDQDSLDIRDPSLSPDAGRRRSATPHAVAAGGWSPARHMHDLFYV